MSTIKIGMASGPLAGTFSSHLATHDPLEAVVCTIGDGRETIALILLDLTQLSVRFCRDLRSQLSKRTGLERPAIWLHCTHTHTAPSENEFCADRIDGLADRLGDLVNRALASAQPATVAYRQADTGGRFNLNRRKAVAELQGAMTVWMGCQNQNGSPDGYRMNHSRLAYWLGREPSASELSSPILYDGPTDGRIQGVFFSTLTGTPIGSLIRYTAHPCIAGHTTQKKYSADFPGVVRRVIREQHGGVCGYLSGPCGNLAPWEQGDWPEPAFPPDAFVPDVAWVPHRDPEACWGEVDRIGRGIAEAIMAAPAGLDVGRLDCFTYKTVPVVLPVRSDLLADLPSALALAEKKRKELFRDRPNLTLPEIKKKVDDIYFLRCHQAVYEEFHYLTPEEYLAKQIPVDISVVRLNDLAFLGLPGEVFWQTAIPAEAAAAARGLHLVSLTECHGDIGYIPTEAERSGGDYECCNSILAPGAETRLAEAARTLIQDI